MKKTLTTMTAFVFTLSLSAQVTTLQQSNAAQQAQVNDKVNITGLEAMPATLAKPVTHTGNSKAWNEEIIGTTEYDLLTNSSIQNRNIYHSDGTISACFTMGHQATGFADRGAGYNYHDGTSWGAMSTTRIESTRNGWPSIGHTANGSEIVISHSTAGGFTLNTRNPKGTGAWTESLIPTNTGHWLLWPRATVGGAAGNTIHMIGITAPTGNGGTEYMGIDGALMYFRSTDEGATWDIVDSILPALDSNSFSSYRADSYQVIADGDDVAIAVYSQWADMVLLKSSDNGDTWASQIVNDFPLDHYVTDQGSDTNGDMIADTIDTSDESGYMLFDDNGMVHMTFGHMRVLDADTTDDNTSYFPGTMELYYWNESMGTGNFTTVAVPEDVNGDLTLDFAGDYALYYTSLCGFPSMGKNADGTIFLTYASYMENYTTSTQNMRHIYVTKTMDGGTTWETALDITPDLLWDGYECVFPTMAPVVDDKIRIMYMRD